MIGSNHEPPRRAMFQAAVLMAGFAVVLIGAGVIVQRWGGEIATIAGWILIGWGAGGLVSALILGGRAWRR